MFYYYGRKKQLAKYYPPPLYDYIVEPFAGSAAYSLYQDNWKKEVILVEKDERVVAVWEWFINEAKPNDFTLMPELKAGESSSEFLHIVHAATKMSFHYKTIKVTPVLARNWEISRRVMANNIHKVKHWTILCGDYTEAPDVEATWFVDPPYKNSSGQGYKYGSDALIYDQLAAWIRSRRGQVICCEGEYGDYLPFEPLRNGMGVAGKTNTEVVYCRSDRPANQLSLFGASL